MITLAATNTLYGDADAASLLSVSVFGMELVGTTETYKVLYQGQLPATPSAPLYIVPGSTTAFIRSITVTNTDTAIRSFQFFVNGSAATNAITPIIKLVPGGFATYEDGGGWQTYTANGSLISGPNSTIPKEGILSINGVFAETLPREICPEVNTTVAASGTLFLQAVYLKAGQLVSNISIHSSTTASATVSGNCVGLYDSALNLLATSANNTTNHAANTLRTYLMTTPYTVTADGLYYVGYFCTATTVATLKGGTAKTGAALAGQAPALHGASSTGLTTSLPATAAEITVGTATIWAGVS